MTKQYTMTKEQKEITTDFYKINQKIRIATYELEKLKLEKLKLNLNIK